MRDLPQPASVKTVGPEERPIDLDAQASLNDPTAAARPGADRNRRGATGGRPSAGKPLAAPVNPPAAAAQNAASPPMASQSPDSEPASTLLPATEPAQITTPTPSATDSGRSAHANDASLPPVKPAQKAASQPTGVPHRSMPLPTKLSGESTAHTVVAKAEATAAGAPLETPSGSLRRGASAKPGKGATTLKAAQARAEAQAAQPEPPLPAQPEPPLPAQQPNPNPVVHAFSSMVGALNGLNPFATH